MVHGLGSPPPPLRPARPLWNVVRSGAVRTVSPVAPAGSTRDAGGLGCRGEWRSSSVVGGGGRFSLRSGLNRRPGIRRPIPHRKGRNGFHAETAQAGDLRKVQRVASGNLCGAFVAHLRQRSIPPARVEKTPVQGRRQEDARRENSGLKFARRKGSATTGWGTSHLLRPAKAA